MPTQKAYGDLAKVTIFRQPKFAQNQLFLNKIPSTKRFTFPILALLKAA